MAGTSFPCKMGNCALFVPDEDVVGTLQRTGSNTCSEQQLKESRERDLARRIIYARARARERVCKIVKKKGLVGGKGGAYDEPTDGRKDTAQKIFSC
ncbi:hypothetical protein ACLOJK_013404 [Asimina triloba]